MGPPEAEGGVATGKEKAAKSRLFRESARGAPYTTLGIGGLYSDDL